MASRLEKLIIFQEVVPLLSAVFVGEGVFHRELAWKRLKRKHLRVLDKQRKVMNDYNFSLTLTLSFEQKEERQIPLLILSRALFVAMERRFC